MDEQTIFSTALTKSDPHERTAWLNEACGNDAELRRRVEALLRAHDDSGSFLDRPPFESGATQAADLDDQRGNQATADAASGMFIVDFLTPCEKPDRLGKLGAYEIIDVIGRGGMGVVLRAFDPKLSRIVAIKVLAPELSANATARKRFLREAQAAAAVSHPHVVTIHAVEDDARLPYLVMECIEGQSLAEKIEKVGMLGVKEILRIGSQIAGGLAAAHKQGLIHRDIKPANILLENGVERVKITDFGLARAVDDVGITRTGEVSGTPQYMSPEQATNSVVDHRSDLFSLGSVLYTMCTGRGPFRADSLIAVIRRVCDDAPRPIQEVNPEIPAPLVETVDKLLAKNPADRFQRAQEVSDLLNDHLAQLQYPSQESHAPASPAVVRPPREARNRKPRWMPRDAAAAVMLVLLGLGMSDATGLTNLAGTVIQLVRGDGLLIVETDDPAVSVTIDHGDLVITGAGPKQVRLKPGLHQLLASKDGMVVHQDQVRILRNGRLVVHIKLEAAPKASQPLHEQPVDEQAFLTDYDLVVRVGRGNLAENERRQLLADNHPLLAQLVDPNTKPLIEMFANLPEESHTALKKTGYLKWRFSTLDAARQTVFENAQRAILLRRTFVDLRPRKEGPAPTEDEQLSINTLTNSGEVGFAVVDVPALSAKVVSGYILLPGRPAGPIWVTVVGTRDAAKPECISAHQLQLPKLLTKAFSGPPQQIAADDPLPEEKPGWVQLLNGRDLAGWMRSPQPMGQWEVKDGILEARTKFRDYLYTDRGDYRNFHLRVEAKINRGGDGGLLFRCEHGLSSRFGTTVGYETEIADLPTVPHGSLRTGPEGPDNTVLAKPGRSRAGEWFRQEVIVEDGHIVVKVDGQTVLDYVAANEHYRQGHIALQVWGEQTELSIRKVEIKELPSNATSSVAPCGQAPVVGTAIGSCRHVGGG